MPATQTAVHPSGLNITFTEDGHTYIDDNDVVYESVTTFVKRFFAPFDSQRIANELSARTGQSPESIIDEWEAAGRYGTRVHEVAEDAINARPPRHVPESEKERLSMSCAWQTAQDLLSRMTVVGCEQIVFSPRYRIAGTIDLMMHDPVENILWILDWKTNKEIRASSYDNTMGLTPVNDLVDANFTHYALQLSMYERIIRDDGYVPPDTVINRALLHVIPDRSRASRLRTPLLRRETAEMLLTTMKSTIHPPPF